MKQYAYIRVSSKDQNIDRQLSAIESFHIPKKQVFCDHQSGKDFDRPAYKRMLRRLKQGDLVVIKSGFLWIVWIVCFMVAEWVFIKYKKGD